MLAQHLNGFLGPRLAEVREDDAQLGKGACDLVEQQRVAPFEDRLRRECSSLMEEDRHAQAVAHLIERPRLRRPRIKALVDGRELEAT